MTHKVQQADPLDLPVDSLQPMSQRLYNLLTEKNGSRSIRDVLGWTKRRMLTTPGMGKQTLAELEQILADRGLALAESPRRDGVLPLPFPSMHQRLTRIEQRLEALEQTAKRGDPP